MIKKQSKSNLLAICILAITLIIVATLVYLIVIYVKTESSRTANFNTVEEDVLQTTELVSVQEIEFFQEKDSYYIVTGLDKVSKEYIVFYPLSNKSEQIQIIEVNETINRDKMMRIWQSDCQDCQFKNMAYAKINDYVLWEITYTDKSNRYVIDYFNLFDGNRYERLWLHTGVR